MADIANDGNIMGAITMCAIAAGVEILQLGLGGVGVEQRRRSDERVVDDIGGDRGRPTGGLGRRGVGRPRAARAAVVPPLPAGLDPPVLVCRVDMTKTAL